MIRNFIRKFGDVAHHVPQGIPKVADTIVWINVIDSEGKKHVISGFVGETMLLTLEKNKIYIHASCRGGDLIAPEYEEPLDPLGTGPSCAECMIEVHEPWANYLKTMSKNELDKITRTGGGYFTRNTRLACCFMLHKWMNGMMISLLHTEPSRLEPEVNYERGYNRNFDY